MSDAPDDAPPPDDAADKGRGSSFLFRRRAGPRSAEEALQPEAPPPPPPRRRRREGALSALSGLLSFLLVLAVAGVFGLVAVLHRLREPGPLLIEKVVYIAPRTDVPDILAQLEREGVIDSPALVNVALLLEGVRAKLKPGEYLFKPNVSLREVMDELVSGRQILHGVTIPEGLTTEQIVARLRESEVLAGDISDLPKEGALLPETYKVARGFSRAKLLAKMQEGQRRLLDQIWARRAADLPVKTPFELVTLASIVEKETGRADERPRVAAVFVNRLRKGMRLQSDPTIVYGLVGGRATLGRGILRSEVEKWTPYNTYAIDGLPPGPIANPGRAALEAVANPSRTQDLYFVADGTGGHAFAETLDQHQKNVQRWRQIEAAAKEKGPGVDRLDPGSAAAPASPSSESPYPLPPRSPLAPREKRGDAAFGRLVSVEEAGKSSPFAFVAAERSEALRRSAGDSGESPRLAAERVAAPAASPPLLAAQFATLALSFVRAAAEPPTSSRLADIDEDEAAPTYPVPNALRAEQRARAQRIGLSTPPDDDPVEDRRAFASASAPPPGRARAFDASEGTPLDPLRDRGWDLSSPKTVPDVAKMR